jgi:electron-transferring-flavoprotein dehydrogenase
MPFTLHDTKPDYACLKLAADCKKIDYPNRTASSASTS